MHLALGVHDSAVYCLLSFVLHLVFVGFNKLHCISMFVIYTSYCFMIIIIFDYANQKIMKLHTANCIFLSKTKK